MELGKEKLKEMLIDIKRVCDENDLKYYLVGGTLLGSIRHGGFIPWDDDIDIALPREDYDRFINLANKLSKELIIRNYNNSKNYPYNYIKVENKNTTLIEEMYEHRGVIGGIYIDVFPLDGVPKNNIKRLVHLTTIKLLKNLIVLHYSNPNKERNSIKKAIIDFAKKCTNEEKLHIILDKKLKKYKYNESKLVSNYLGAYGKREIVNKEIFGIGKIIKFENEMFLGPERADEYLTIIYGDYMKLPPIEKRKSHHGIKYVNLNESFINYKK